MRQSVRRARPGNEATRPRIYRELGRTSAAFAPEMFRGGFIGWRSLARGALGNRPDASDRAIVVSNARRYCVEVL